MTEKDKKLAEFCFNFEMDCNYCPNREECDDFQSKYDMLPMRAYLRAYLRAYQRNGGELH